jgi:hypothetical protein
MQLHRLLADETRMDMPSWYLARAMARRRSSAGALSLRLA